MEYIYQLEQEVRDYECDIQGIVNNANYLHYTEHTRHKFLKQTGISFAQLHEKGIDAVVARMNLQYKTPLRCDDVYVSCLYLKKEGIKYVFYQDIYRKSDHKISFKAVVDVVCIVNGRLSDSEEMATLLAPYINKE